MHNNSGSITRFGRLTGRYKTVNIQYQSPEEKQERDRTPRKPNKRGSQRKRMIAPGRLSRRPASEIVHPCYLISVGVRGLRNPNIQR
ncbi:hypothetical protein CERSUDRAFT_82034 [Gelatoporia subvermispora B]|uniref:Uncharacterized protein n=1 Tax=Ceriporiopsis subvermispora (strain B) TaxID=914234 RepID=M2R427_CERS8|nr:hypothetical protein CERSUDRAFT_82034 [Gelatoporia subvermispora B]